jgi:hypothetical protein
MLLLFFYFFFKVGENSKSRIFSRLEFRTYFGKVSTFEYLSQNYYNPNNIDATSLN